MQPAAGNAGANLNIEIGLKFLEWKPSFNTKKKTQ